MPAITASVTLRISEGLLRRVDEARLTPEAARLVGVPSNLVVSRNAWLVWAVERALGEAAAEVAEYREILDADPGDSLGREVPASAEQPERPGVSEAERRGLANFAEGASRSVREFRPYPKGG